MADEKDKDTDEHRAVDAEVVEDSKDDGGAVAAGETTEVSFSRTEPSEAADADDAPAADTTADAPVEDAPVTDPPVEDAPVEDAPVEAAPVTDAPAEAISETAAPFGDAPSTTPPPNVSAPPAFSGSTGGTSPAAADRAASEDTDKFAERPELFVGAAFLGAFVLAKLLGRLAGDDDE